MYERTPEIRKKISEALKVAHKNRPGAWRDEYVVTEETKKKLSEAHKGRKLNPEWIANRTKAQRGLKRSLETRVKLSEAKKGDKSPFWSGGISHINHTERKNAKQTFEYRDWRKQVFERDNYTCTTCGERGGSLHADHIKPYALYPDLRLSVENGRTMCPPCHKSTDTYGIKVNKLIKA